VDIKKFEKPDARLFEIFHKSKHITVCPACTYVQPKWEITQKTFIRPVFMTPSPKHVNPERLVLILRNITREDVFHLGLHPDISPPYAMFWSNLVVPSVAMRPSRCREDSFKIGGEDDLTIKLRNIVKVNNHLRDTLKHIDPVFGSKVDLNMLNCTRNDEDKSNYHYVQLQRFVSGYIDSRFQPATYNEQTRYKTSLRERLVGRRPKEGRLRYTVFGKRQDQSARTVITPSSDIQVDEIGVPLHVCMQLTFPETVNRHNHSRLKSAVVRGTTHYPGANFILRKQSGHSGGTYHKISLLLFTSERRERLDLHQGDIVLRHLVAGDWVLMNRQPSLHMLSIMAHKVRPTAGYSFKLHVACTQPYNADFDGDEMNMLPAQSIKTSAEMQYMMSVGRNIVNNGKVWVSFQQHSPVAAYLLSRDTQITPSIAACLLVEFPTIRLPRSSAVHGRTIIELCFPEDFTVRAKGLEIVNGCFVSGELTKENINSGLVYTYFYQYGPERTVAFMSSFQRMLETYLRLKGLTMGVTQCSIITDQALKLDTIEQTESAISAANHNLASIAKSPTTLANQREANITESLDMLRNIYGDRCLSKLNHKPRHSLLEMVRSGSKGNVVNIIQNSTMIGQQYDYRGNRLTPRVGCASEFSLEECGFVSNSFLSGMSPVEYFSHLRASRTGLVDTAVKTSETGYTARKLCKLLESVVIRENNGRLCAVNVQSGIIVQYKYAYDNFNSHTSKLYKLPVDFDQAAHLFMGQLFHPEPIPDISQPLRFHKHYALTDPFRYPKLIWDCGPITGPVYLGFDIDMLIYQCQPHADDIQLTRLEVETLVLVLLDQLQPPNQAVRCLLLCKLAPWNIPRAKSSIAKLIHDIRETWYKSLVRNGDTVGVQAGQSCTHPMTQLALNTFHKSGEESDLVSGMTIIKDITCLTNNPTSACCDFTFTTEVEARTWADKLVTKRVADHVESWSHTRGRISCTYVHPKVFELAASTFSVVRPVAENKFEVEFAQTEYENEFSKISKNGKITPDAEFVEMHLFHKFMEQCWGVSQITECRVRGRKIRTIGSNLKQSLNILPLEVGMKCTSTHVRDVSKVLGIDAARVAIIRVLNKVLPTTSRRHILLLASTMTCLGRLTASTQAGLKSFSQSVIQRASFEKVTSVLTCAAVHGQKDANNTIPENILWNSLCKIGSGDTRIEQPPRKENTPKRKKLFFKSYKHLAKNTQYFTHLFGKILFYTAPNQNIKLSDTKKKLHKNISDIRYFGYKDGYFVISS
jgi:DNA-directed RNA polymerase beta' subunit